MSDEITDIDLAVTWFLAARAMSAAGGEIRADDATAGLYAQSILALSEDVCVEAKTPERIGSKTLINCLSAVGRLPRPTAEQIITGVLLIAYGAGRHMDALQVRWASMLASAAELTTEDFQRCCASSRVIAAMMRPELEASGE